MTDFVIISAVAAQMLQHVDSEPDREVCGLLGGRDDQALVAVAIPNVAPTPQVRYEMDRQAMVEAVMRLRRDGMDVVGVYHSHPHDPPTPSITDIAEATWPDVVYVIIGREKGQQVMRGWSLRRGQAVEVNLHDEWGLPS
ncbi:MAG: M67 family metallopeptidase [Anaerolineae bacterium]|nr:M67 family metallopeptidase [Anaerolineae bacterium]